MITWKIWSKKEYDAYISGVIRRIKNKDLDGFLQVRNKPVGKKGYDLIIYVEKKNNKNIYVIGGARSGKTTLGEYLCLKLEERKIIISFKKFLPTKRDFDIGYRWIDVTLYLPNLFSDRQSFIEAFRTAFFSDLSMKGLTIDTILSRVNDVMQKEPKDFQEFYKILDRLAGRGQWEENIKTIIKSKVQLLERVTAGAKHGSVDFSKGNIVLDLGNLPDAESKTFLAEYYLRQINRIEQQEQREEKIRVVIDECWHLLRYRQQNSIVGTILLEGAHYIRFLCITQNYTHLDEDYRSHFGAIFCFRNTNDKDMQAIEKGYGVFVRDGIIRLRDHEFIDLKYEHDEDVIPVWKLNYERLQALKLEAKSAFNEHDESFVEEEHKEVKTEHKQREIEEKIIDLLQHSNIALTKTEICEKIGIANDLNSYSILRNLIKSKRLNSDDILERNKEVAYYYKIPDTDEQFHNAMLGIVKKKLLTVKKKFEENSRGNSGADFYLDELIIECESGHKRDWEKIKTQFLSYNPKTTLIVVPNIRAKKSYEEFVDENQMRHCKVLFIPELVEFLRNG